MNFVSRKGLPFILLLGIGILCIAGCKPHGTVTTISPQDSVMIVRSIEQRRAEADNVFRNDPESPFRKDTSVQFHGINWFPINLKYFFRSRLYKSDHPEPVTILGTKGEERKEIKYGYFLIPYEGRDYKLNVYKSAEESTDLRMNRELSVWFTDATTGKETYGVGRYLEVGEEVSDPNHLYILDFNNCYNPYCAYTPIYSCAVPRQEDHLDFPIYAGEKKYHE